MRPHTLAYLAVFLFTHGNVHAKESSPVSMRYHTQWQVCEAIKARLKKRYGLHRVNFTKKGKPIPHGLSPAQMQRWTNFYKQCMRDGCYFCDANEGSCEAGTCGPNNRDCKPVLGADGLPQCGPECADYAFSSTLT